MALDEFTKETAKRQIEVFIDKRVPPHAREQVNLTYSFWRDSVILYEVIKAPFPVGSESIVTSKIARMDFNEESKGWTLWAYDRNEAPLQYPHLDDGVSLEEVIAEIDEDSTGIFWG